MSPNQETHLLIRRLIILWTSKLRIILVAPIGKSTKNFRKIYIGGINRNSNKAAVTNKLFSRRLTNSLFILKIWPISSQKVWKFVRFLAVF